MGHSPRGGVLGSLLAAALVSGCASDRYLASSGHNPFLSRDFDKAAEIFANEAAKPSSNQVLFLFDQGSSLFAARRYKEAIDVFLKAEKLTQIKDYTSLSEEVGTLTTSDNIRGYKGEDFEKVLVNVYLALSFAAIGNLESAQVEARKINNILQKMITDGKRNYEESPFARYLSALLWEASRDYNSAYIDYKLTYKLDPQFPGLGGDLLAMAAKMRFQDEYRQWTEKFPNVEARRIDKGQGEIVVIFERGLSPVKVPRGNQDSSLPMYIARSSRVQMGRLIVNGSQTSTLVPVLDIEALSIRYLEDRIGRMAASKVAGTIVKGAIAAGVGRLSKDEDLGMLTFIALLATDRADLRSWRTLPAALMMMRTKVPAGQHSVVLEALDASGIVVNRIDFGQVTVKSLGKTFLVGR